MPVATIEVPAGAVRDGDVVFIAAPQLLWARLASRFSLPSLRNGHVGIAVVHGATVEVVHASGNPVAADSVVQRVAIAGFVADATVLRIFRPVDRRIAVAAARQAERFAAARVPFDTSFSLASSNRLYCTELVWRALSAAAGHDILPFKTRVAGRDAATLSDIETLAMLAPAGTILARPATSPAA